MKRLIIVPLLALGLARVAVGAPALFYVNDGIINATNPPVIDAINFINNNTFDVFTFRPYRTASTLNFTNRGEMSGNPGFDFRTFPESTGSARMASSFHNKATGANGGVINCTGSFSFIIANLLFGNLTGRFDQYGRQQPDSAEGLQC
jgi:predicted outer membrane repeat protein